MIEVSTGSALRPDPVEFEAQRQLISAHRNRLITGTS
jgi:hypothetical protein